MKAMKAIKAVMKLRKATKAKPATTAAKASVKARKAIMAAKRALLNIELERHRQSHRDLPSAIQVQKADAPWVNQVYDLVGVQGVKNALEERVPSWSFGKKYVRLDVSWATPITVR